MLTTIPNQGDQQRGNKERYKEPAGLNDDLNGNEEYGTKDYYPPKLKEGAVKPSPLNIKNSEVKVSNKKLKQEVDYEEMDDSNAPSEVRKLATGISKESIRSKLSSVNKDKSRMGKRRASMSTIGNTNNKGTISVAMQILNMDEEEKE